jgi:hypothetical protein
MVKIIKKKLTVGTRATNGWRPVPRPLAKSTEIVHIFSSNFKSDYFYKNNFNLLYFTIYLFRIIGLKWFVFLNFLFIFCNM